MKQHNAIFLVGGPGSGKDFILRTALKESQATEIPLAKLIRHIEEKIDYPEIDGRPLILSGNADDDQSVLLAKAVLEAMGYTTACIHVYVNPDVSKARSKIDESKRHAKYIQSGENMYKFKNTFAEGFFLFDNSSDFINCSEETQTQVVLWIEELSETVEDFFESKSYYHDEKLGFKIPRVPKPVGGEPKGGHPVPAGYERVKEGSFYKLRKKPVPLANQDDTQTDGTGLKEDIDGLFEQAMDEKTYPTVIDMMAQKKNRRGESQGDKYKGGIAVPGDKATQRETGTGQAEATSQKHIITFHHNTSAYRVHSVGCPAAKATKHVTAIQHEGDAHSALQWCHEDEAEKGGKQADAKICKCVPKHVAEEKTNQEVVVTQTQAKGVKYRKDRPAKGAGSPPSYFDGRIGTVPSGGIGLTAYKTEETEPKTVRDLRKK